MGKRESMAGTASSETDGDEEEARGRHPGDSSRHQRAVLQRCAGLTERERQVLAISAMGATASEAARLLRISPDEVRAHVDHIKRILQVPSKLAAVVMALEAGVIEEPLAE